MTIPVEIDLAFKAAEFVALVGGGLALFYRIGRMTMKFEQIVARQAVDISELKIAVKALVTSTTRIDRLEERQLAEGRRLDETVSLMNRMLLNKIAIDRSQGIG